jgi:hypothetical protein
MLVASVRSWRSSAGVNPGRGKIRDGDVVAAVVSPLQCGGHAGTVEAGCAKGGNRALQMRAIEEHAVDLTRPILRLRRASVGSGGGR